MMDTRKALMQQINMLADQSASRLSFLRYLKQIKLLKVNAETKSRLAELVTDLYAEAYAEAWDDGYAAALEENR